MNLFNHKKTFSFIALLFFFVIQINAKDVIFDFQSNPWNLPTAGSGVSADKSKLDETIQINQEGVIITNQKLNEKYYNKLSGGSLVIYAKNSITISAPRGFKIIVHIEPNVIDGIARVTTLKTPNAKIYNLQGVEVGTLSTFNSLPKGIYIIENRKVVKR